MRIGAWIVHLFLSIYTYANPPTVHSTSVLGIYTYSTFVLEENLFTIADNFT